MANQGLLIIKSLITDEQVFAMPGVVSFADAAIVMPRVTVNFLVVEAPDVSGKAPCHELTAYLNEQEVEIAKALTDLVRERLLREAQTRFMGIFNGEIPEGSTFTVTG